MMLSIRKPNYLGLMLVVVDSGGLRRGTQVLALPRRLKNRSPRTHRPIYTGPHKRTYTSGFLNLHESSKAFGNEKTYKTSLWMHPTVLVYLYHQLCFISNIDLLYTFMAACSALISNNMFMGCWVAGNAKCENNEMGKRTVS